MCAVSPRWEGPVHGLCVLSVKCGRGQCVGCVCCQSNVSGCSGLCLRVSQIWVRLVRGLSVKCWWGLCDVFTVSVGRVYGLCLLTNVGRAYELFTVKSGWGLWTVFTVRCGWGLWVVFTVSQMWVGLIDCLLSYVGRAYGLSLIHI